MRIHFAKTNQRKVAVTLLDLKQTSTKLIRANEGALYNDKDIYDKDIYHYINGHVTSIQLLKYVRDKNL